MSLLLDTNVVSELRKGTSANSKVFSWFREVPPQDVYLSVLVIGELRRGVESVRRRDAKQATALTNWLARVVRDHDDRILSVDRSVAEEWGRLTAQRPGSVIDTLMAATAIVHGFVLVTRNVKDIEWTGVSYMNPF